MSTIQKKRHTVDYKRKSSNEPPMRKQKLDLIRKLSLPSSIQQIITCFAEINYEKIKISSTEILDSTAPCGDIEFAISYGDAPDKLGTFHGSFDEEYKRMDILNDTPWRNHKFEIDELEYFETGDYQHDEPEMNEFMKQSLLCVIEYIHSYQDGHYQTLKISNYIIESLKIDTNEFEQKWDPFHVNKHAENSHYLFRKPTPPSLFNHTSLQPYIHPCTLLLKKREDFICKASDLQKNYAIVPDEKMGCLLSYFCRMNQINFFDDFPDVIVDEIDHYQEKNKVDAIEFKRNCMVMADDGPTIQVIFDFPLTLISEHIGDLCFKLKINETVLTADKFYFDGGFGDDMDYRINKYTQSDNLKQFYVNRYSQILSFYRLDTQSRYSSFDEEIRSENGIKILDLSDDWMAKGLLDEEVDLLVELSNENW